MWQRENEEVEVKRRFCATHVAPGARVVMLALAGRRREEAEEEGVCVCEKGRLLRAAAGATFTSQNCNSFQC